MPEHYDSSSGVTELDTRVSILNAFRQGWIPAVNGEVSIRYMPEGPSSGTKRKAPRVAPLATVRFALGKQAAHNSKRRTQQPESYSCLTAGLDKPPSTLRVDTSLQPTPGSSPTGGGIHLPVLQDLGVGHKQDLQPKATADNPLRGCPSLDNPTRVDVKDPGPLLPDSGPSSNRGWIVVYHIKSFRVHASRDGIAEAACGWWTCGTPDQLMNSPAFIVEGVDPVSDLGCEWCSRCKEKLD